MTKVILQIILLAVLFCTTKGQIGEKILIIHGGAGTITTDHANAKKLVMMEAIRAGYAALQNNDDAQSAVELSIRAMEDSPAFNAGTGSVLTITGEVECDSIIVNGTDLTAGAVGAVRHIKNPITLAKLVKDRSEHVFMVGYEAEMFALNNGVTLVPTSDLIANLTFRTSEIEETTKKCRTAGCKREPRSSYFDVGTVGAVAINSRGQIFAGTSTGGLSKKLNGRVGDTPIVGGGTLADDLIGGISATGWGEAFIRYRVASRVAMLIEQGQTPTNAINNVLQGMASRIEGADGGIIAISKDGVLGFGWNSEQMAWAYSDGADIHYGVDRGEDIVVPLNPGSTTTTETNNNTTSDFSETTSPSTSDFSETTTPSTGNGVVYRNLINGFLCISVLLFFAF